MQARAPLGWSLVIGLILCGSVTAQTGPAPYSPASPQQFVQNWSPPPHPHHTTSPPAPDYAQLLPQDRGFFYDRDSRLDLTIGETLSGSWMRLEYLGANVERKKGRVLGTPGANVKDVTEPFDLTDDIPQQIVVPTTDSVDWQHINGIRGTFGIPIGNKGWVETRFWGLEETSDDIDTPIDLPGNPLASNVLLLATTLTTDGEPGTRIILYDRSFFSDYTTDLYSADINFVYNFRTPDEGFWVQPLIGYRHEEYGERLIFGGSFDNSSGIYDGLGTLTTPQSNRIDSKVHNFRNQLQFGVRTQFTHRFFDIGVEPKIAFGSNLVRSRVTTSDVRDPGNLEQFFDPDNAIDDPAFTNSRNRDLIFAPSFDLSLYANIKLTEWLRLRAGWDVVWLGRLGAADRSIRLNEITPDPEVPEVTVPDVVVDRKLADRIVTMFTIGGEILLP